MAIYRITSNSVAGVINYLDTNGVTQNKGIAAYSTLTILGNAINSVPVDCYYNIIGSSTGSNDNSNITSSYAVMAATSSYLYTTVQDGIRMQSATNNNRINFYNSTGTYRAGFIDCLPSSSISITAEAYSGILFKTNGAVRQQINPDGTNIFNSVISRTLGVGNNPGIQFQNNSNDVLMIRYNDTAVNKVPSGSWHFRTGGTSSRPIVFSDYDGNSSTLFFIDNGKPILHSSGSTNSAITWTKGDPQTRQPVWNIHRRAANDNLQIDRFISGSYQDNPLVIDNLTGNVTLAPNKITYTSKIHNGVLRIEGDSIYRYDTIGDDQGLAINYAGYNNTNQYFRDTKIYNGKYGIMTKWNGASGSVEFSSTLQMLGGENLEIRNAGALRLFNSTNSAYSTTYFDGTSNNFNWAVKMLGGTKLLLQNPTGSANSEIYTDSGNTLQLTGAGQIQLNGNVYFAQGAIQQASNEVRIFANTAKTLTLGANGQAAKLTINVDGTSTFASKVTAPNIDISGPVGYREFTFQTNGSRRFNLFCGPNAESGSDAGSEFNLAYYNDSGSYKGNVFSANRNGQVFFDSYLIAKNGLQVNRNVMPYIDLNPLDDAGASHWRMCVYSNAYAPASSASFVIESNFASKFQLKKTGDIITYGDIFVNNSKIIKYLNKYGKLEFSDASAKSIITGDSGAQGELSLFNPNAIEIGVGTNYNYLDSVARFTINGLQVEKGKELRLYNPSNTAYNTIYTDANSNLVVSSSIALVGGTPIKNVLSISQYYDPVSIPAYGNQYVDVTINNGVAPSGNWVCFQPTHTTTPNTVIITANIIANNTIRVNFYNTMGSAIDITNGILRVACMLFG